MRRFAALVSLVSLAASLVACKVEADEPAGFEPGMAGEPMAPEMTPCGKFDVCLSRSCDFSMPSWCDMPENAGDEQCAGVDAELESCIATCAAANPEASDEDVMVSVAGQQCNAAAVTADDVQECSALAVECQGPE